jgi:GWxTD domain-containing protein
MHQIVKTMNKKNSPPGAVFSLATATFALACLALLLTGCAATGSSVRTLPPSDRQFLSEVRYLISKKEIKIFKNTAPEERQKFIEEFWKARDPDPTTEENEFRDEYYRRIDEANRLFREGSSGWLSDRGRIFILLGAPERRDVFPSGYSFYEPPVEIWYYVTFPILFVDYSYQGIYKLDPSSARRISMINVAQQRLKPQGITRNVRFFDFSLKSQDAGPGQATLTMEIPYRVINLIQNEASGAYETRLKMTILVQSQSGEKVLEKEEFFPIAVTQDMLAQLGRNHAIEFPIRLPAGKYSAQVSLENTADKSHCKKMIDFVL